MTLEALVLHTVENLDAKLNGFLGFAERFLDPQRPGWTQFCRDLDRYLYLGAPAAAPEPDPTPAPDPLERPAMANV